MPEREKMYEWTVFSRFSLKQVWFWHKWPFWGKSYFKVLQVSRGDLLHLRHSMYCTMICLRHRKSNHFNFRWCKKYSGVKGDRFTHGYLPSSVLHEFGLCSPICQIFSPDWVLFFYPHASHHSKASVLVWRTWYANWVQYVPAFILSQLGVWLMAMNL